MPRMTGEVPAANMAPLGPGDVRIFLKTREALAGAAATLLVSEVVSVTELDQEYHGLSGVYSSSEVPALVPDIRTTRHASGDLIAQHLRLVDEDGGYNPEDPRHIRIYGPDEAATVARIINAGIPMSSTVCPPGQLTTTVNGNTRLLQGLHRDREDEYIYRIGLNVGPANRMSLIGTHSVAVLPGLSANPTNDEVRVSIIQHPGMRLFHLLQPPGWAYRMWTGSVFHDASTLFKGAPNTYTKILPEYVLHDDPRPMPEGYSRIDFASLLAAHRAGQLKGLG